MFTGNVAATVSWVSAEGGASRPVTKLDPARKEQAHIWPELLSEGKKLLYLARSADPEAVGIYMTSLDESVTTEQPALLTRTPVRAHAILIGGKQHLLYINNGSPVHGELPIG